MYFRNKCRPCKLIVVLSIVAIFFAGEGLIKLFHNNNYYYYIINNDDLVLSQSSQFRQHYYSTRQQQQRRLLELQVEENDTTIIIENEEKSYENFTSYIVGGKDSDPYASYGFPVGSGLCGATLIHEEWLISAGHCIGYFVDAGIYIGGNKLDGSTSTKYNVKYEIRHEQYTSNPLSNDILLIKLQNPITNIPIQRINEKDTVPKSNTSVIALGYGNTIPNDNGSISSTLKSVELTIASNQACRDYWGSTKFKNNSMICTFDPSNNKKDTCQGDSGGPILRKSDNLQIGLVSFSDGCAKPNSKGVNMRLSYYIPWIRNKICKYSEYYIPSYCTESTTDNISDSNNPAITTPPIFGGGGGSTTTNQSSCPIEDTCKTFIISGSYMHINFLGLCIDSCQVNFFVNLLKLFFGYKCGMCPTT